MANNLLGVWSTIGSVLLAIFILLVMITVHEFGHYLAGKLLNFKINEFSIGFGPALFKHKSKKSGELFSIRLIPLGGYCAFAGEDGLEEEQKTEAMPEPFAEEFSENAAESVGAPESVSAGELTTSEAEALPSAESEKKKKRKKKPKRPRAEAGNFNDKKPWQRIIVLVAGALMNYVLAVFLITVCFFAYGQTMTAVYQTAADDTGIYNENNSLMDKDILLKANGKSIYLTTDIVSAVNKKKAGDTVEFYLSRVQRDENGELIKKEDGSYLRKEEKVQVMLRSDVKVKNSAELDSAWEALGFDYLERDDYTGYAITGASYRFGFFETLGRSFMYSFKIAGSIFKIIGELLTGNLGITALGGPVTTIKMTSEIASTSFRGLLEIAGYIGVNLAVFNLLPIPALDGSKVIFTVIEWIRKKPVSRKVEGAIHAVGFILLLGFAVLVDILQFVL